MAATVLGVATGGTPGTNWGTAFPVNVPAGTVDGDLLIAINVSEYSTIANSLVPAGFTRLTTSEYDGNTHGLHLSLGYRVASSEPASYTFASGSGSANVGAIFRVGSHDAAVVISQTTPAAGRSAPPVALNGTDDLLMTFHITRTGGSSTLTWTPPAGMTERVDLTRGNYVSLSANTLESPASAQSRTAVGSFSDESVSSAISIKGTPAAPSRSGNAKVWDGSSWVSAPAKVWDGATWANGVLKVWDGSAWVVAK